MEPNYGPAHKFGQVKLPGPGRSCMRVDSKLFFKPANFFSEKSVYFLHMDHMIWPKRPIFGVHVFIASNAFNINFISGTSYKRLNGTSFRSVFKLIAKLRPLIGSLRALI